MNQIPCVLCRRCYKSKTLGHVIGECLTGKLNRIQGHDKIVQLVADKCIEASLLTAREQAFDTEEGTLRPDLVVLFGQSALIMDVTIRFEQAKSFAEAASEKVAKYERIFQEVKRCMGASSAEVLPLVFGSRGAIPQGTIWNLTRLGLGTQTHMAAIV